MRVNNIYGILSVAGVAAMLVIGLFTSCKKDTTQPGEDVVILDDLYEISYTQEGGVQKFVMYSNIGEWKLLPTYEEDWEWVRAWPKEGKDNAIFTVAIQENTSAYPRTCDLNIVCGDKIMSKITFNQDGCDPVMDVKFTAASKVVSALGEDFKIKVNANIDWRVIIPEPDSWLRLAEHTDEYQIFTADPNLSDTPREMTVSFVVDGTSIQKPLKIHQAEHSMAFDTATKITIAELKEMMATKTGLIEDNVYIEGYVVSDCLSQNFGPTQMMVMDETNTGVLLDFDDESSNDYPVNSFLTIHLLGQNIGRDLDTQAPYIKDFTRAVVMKSVETEGIAPIELNDISEIGNYQNCLVKVKDVEFVLPYGTFVNILETSIGADYGTYDITNSLPYAELNTEYVQLLRDAQGNVGQLLTLGSYIERASMMAPNGSGDIVGVVMSRMKAAGIVYNLHLRTNADCQVSDDELSRHSKVVMQIGPWTSYKGGLPRAVASVGTGQLLHSATTEEIRESATAGNASMYFGWSYARCAPAEYISGTWVPLYANTINVQYACVVAQDWWNNNFNRIEDCLGVAWLIKTNTVGWNGQLSLDITQASSSSGPMYFTLEYGESENAPLADWTPVATYAVANTSVSPALKEYTIDLPEECNNRSNIIFRLRVPNDRRAKNTSTPVDAAGTSRIGVVRISCR